MKTVVVEDGQQPRELYGNQVISLKTLGLGLRGPRSIKIEGAHIQSVGNFLWSAETFVPDQSNPQGKKVSTDRNPDGVELEPHTGLRVRVSGWGWIYASNDWDEWEPPTQ